MSDGLGQQIYGAVVVLLMLGVAAYFVLRRPATRNRLREVVDRDTRGERDACAAEWEDVLVWAFPNEPTAAARMSREMFEDWYEEWRHKRTPAWQYMLRKFKGMPGIGNRLERYPKWVEAGRPNPMTWWPENLTPPWRRPPGQTPLPS